MEKHILFDVDGVFLSEEKCFDVTALSVYELLYGDNYLNLSEDTIKTEYKEDELNDIRRKVLDDEKILRKMKDKGLNSNWDMLFIVFSLHLIRLIKANRKQFNDDFNKIDHAWLSSVQMTEQGIDFTFPNEFLDQTESGKSAIYEALIQYAKDELNSDNVEAFQLKSELWHLGQTIFQEWYLGEKYHKETSQKESILKGKPGFLDQEEILCDKEAIKVLLQDLKKAGYKLGIATGRPRIETLVPFKALDLLEEFDEHYIVTATEVLKAESMHPDHRPLGKPNPFCYIASYFGNEEDNYIHYIEDQKVLDKDKCIIVGDSLADYYAAEESGAYFVATLTGLKGQEERATFEELKADAILDDVLGLRALLLK